MEQLSEHNKPSLDRRRFIGNSFKLAVLAGILAPLEQACNTKSKNPTTTPTGNTTDKNKPHTAKNKSNRHKWNSEKLIINAKTNTAHLPTSAVYVYYDQIKNIRDVSMNDWENQVKGPVRLNKDKSGSILEILSLQKLHGEVNDLSLDSAMNTLSKAFNKECENSKGVNYNSTNYRLHELMLQLVALNNGIPITAKWQTFNEMVRKPPKLGKRQSWMGNETSFNERLKYIRDREADYKNRLSLRATKHTFI